MAKTSVLVVAAVVEHEGHYLITQRNESAVFPMLWEFPGGRVEEGESETAALIREVSGRIGVEVSVTQRLADHFHEYDDYEVHLSLFACSLPPGAIPRAIGVKDTRWVRSDEMDDYEFPPADQTSMAKLLNLDH